MSNPTVILISFAICNPMNLIHRRTKKNRGTNWFTHTKKF